MIKVFQQRIEKGKGDCMQAAIASLFECTMEETPKFIEYSEGYFPPLYEFIKVRGYDLEGYLYPNTPIKELSFDELKNCQGVNGFFYASVYSPKFNPDGHNSGTTHAVIVDKEGKVVHDPNPNYQDFKYPVTEKTNSQGIIHIMLLEPIKSDE